MKILVPIKRVPDPTAKVKVKDGALDLTGVSYIVNPFDEYAVETALRLLENGDTGAREGEIVVLTLGPDEGQKELRQCLAMGADRAIHVQTQDAAIDSLMVTHALRAIIETEKPDLVLMGKQAVDGDANQVAQMLAAKLNWPQATFAATIELGTDKKTLSVGREVDGGVEYKRVPLPAVVSVDLRIVASASVKNNVTPASFAYGNDPRLPGAKGIMGAKKKPMDIKTLADLGVTSTPVIKETSVTLPAARKAGQFVPDVPTLVAKLVNEAKAL